MGILLRFGLPDSSIAQFIFSRNFNNETCPEGSDVLEIGEIIQVSSYNADGDSFLCSVVGKVFRDQEGNYIRQTVSINGVLLVSGVVLCVARIMHIILIKGGALVSGVILCAVL